MIAAACLVVLLSRAPFLWGNPDWGPLWGPEQCFLLSAPEIHARRQAADPGVDVPYYLVDPEQFRTHYHGGTVLLGKTLKLLSRVLHTRSLVIVKIVGTLYTVLCAGLLAWAWRRVYRDRGRTGLATAVFLLSFSPYFFLWATLIPLGHYIESHLFFGLFLPFFAEQARNGLTRFGVIAAGLLAGLSIFYVFSNAIFFGVLLAAFLLRAGQPLVERLKTASLAVLACLVVLVVLGRPAAVVTRFFSSGIWADEGAEKTALSHEWEPVRSVVQRYVDTLLGYFGVLEARFPGWNLEWLAAVVVGLLLSTGAVVLAVQVVKHLRSPSNRTPGQRFLAYNGWLLGAFTLAYVAFDPDVGDPTSMSAPWYLAPTYPLLFIGFAALVQWGLSRSSPRARWLTILAVVPAGGILVLGWAAAVAVDARDDSRPDLAWCDSACIDGYFWEDQPSEIDPGDRLQEHASSAGVVVARERGEERCARANPGDEQACVLAGYAIELIHGGDDLDCSSEPAPRREVCARAVGAVHYAEASCEGHEPPTDEMCSGLDGSLRWACLSGAAQGTNLDFSSRHCSRAFALQCEDSFRGAAERSACMEQGAALLPTAPLLPRPPDDLPETCEPWPFAWRGLCARAVGLSSRPRAGRMGPSCDDLYLERFADALPPAGGLAYDECLVASPAAYPWCAIGVARRKGETECQWLDDETDGALSW